MTVLDASAVLALLYDEHGGDLVVELLGEGSCAISAVNVAEVAGVLHRDAVPEVAVIVRELLAHLSVVPFALEHAERVGELLPLTSAHGLSLGDRACLALAAMRGEPVLTADRAWAELPNSVGVEVRLIR